ncbi:MAG: hypothetical protein H6R26_2802, partial [Proteobacteria bacterium]|nr:hypothetical protein [Pseudomonadota bacterium]
YQHEHGSEDDKGDIHARALGLEDLQFYVPAILGRLTRTCLAEES